MSTRKNAVSQAVQTLVQNNAPEGVEVWTPCLSALPSGKHGLGKDETIVSSAVTAMQGEDSAQAGWLVLGDALYTKGIRAAMLRGKDRVSEVVEEVRNFIAHIRFGNVIATQFEGKTITAAADLATFWGDHKAAAWSLMPQTRRDLAKVRANRIGMYFERLCDALAVHETGKKKGRETLTVEEQYLKTLGPVLLLLQKIDLTKVDPKFDWNEEFDSISRAVQRAKVAVKLATGKVVK